MGEYLEITKSQIVDTYTKHETLFTEFGRYDILKPGDVFGIQVDNQIVTYQVGDDGTISEYSIKYKIK